MMMMISRHSFINDSLRMFYYYLFTTIVFYLLISSKNVVQGAPQIIGTGVSVRSLASTNTNANSINLESPCPSVFYYNWDGAEWYGIIIVPSFPYGTTARLIARLSIDRVLPTKYAGSLELISPSTEVLHAMLTEQPIRYRVNFPLSYPLPMVTSITLNDRLICSGPTVNAPVVTSITLEHTLYPQRPSDAQSDVITQQPVKIYDYPVNKPPASFSPIITNGNNNNNNDFLNNPINFRPFKNQTVASADRETSDSGNRFRDEIYLNDICGKSVHFTPLIANGNTTKRGSYPWLVALFVQKNLGIEFTCGATLISNKFVITAAHCIRYGENPMLKPDQILLFLGKYLIHRWTEQGSIIRNAKEIFMHPDYKSINGDADLAAIEMEETVPFTDTIRPICLFSTNNNSNNHYENIDKGIIVGWGRDENGLKVTSEPRQVTVQIVSQEDCLRSRYEFHYITSNRTICAGGILPESGPCLGDSGGGLFVRIDENDKWYFKGIISMSLADPRTKSCDLKNYSVFVNVNKFLDWIQQFISSN